MNPLTHLRPIHAKNLWFQKRSGFVWTGAINWYLKDLVTVPLICWLRSALIYLQQKEISHLHSRNLLEITATNNITRNAYARSAYQGYKLGCVRLRNPDFWFWNRTRNPKTDFISEKSVLRVKGWIRILWISFYLSIGKSEKGFAKLFSWTAVFFLLIMRAHARPRFLRAVCQILFRIYQLNSKKENQKSQCWNPFSDFVFDCKSEIRILKSKSRFPNRMHP